MFPKYILDSLDGIEDALQPVYEEQDGKFHLNGEKYVEQVTAGLKTNNATLKKEKDRLKTDFEAFKKKFDGIGDEQLTEFRDWQERRALTGDGDPTDPKKAAEDDTTWFFHYVPRTP